MTAVISEKLKTLAKDLSTDFPSSARRKLGGFVLAARCVDKCRATLNGTNGEYHFDCPLDNYFLKFAGVNSSELKDFVATGASDDEVCAWISEHATQKDQTEIVKWNNSIRYKTLKDLEPDMQVFFEGYIEENLPKNAIVNVWLDIYDIEEKRITPQTY